MTRPYDDEFHLHLLMASLNDSVSMTIIMTNSGHLKCVYIKHVSKQASTCLLQELGHPCARKRQDQDIRCISYLPFPLLSLSEKNSVSRRSLALGEVPHPTCCRDKSDPVSTHKTWSLTAPVRPAPTIFYFLLSSPVSASETPPTHTFPANGYFSPFNIPFSLPPQACSSSSLSINRTFSKLLTLICNHFSNLNSKVTFSTKPSLNPWIKSYALAMYSQNFHKCAYTVHTSVTV